MVTKALIIVDVENDFLPGGSLAIKEGDQIIPIINEIQSKFELIVATLDWHPPHHISFAKTHNKEVGERLQVEGIEQILWPIHCVQGTNGAKFAPSFNTQKVKKIFYKGADPKVDSYSAFYDNKKLRSTGLDIYLKENKVTSVYLAGLTTEYCVKYSALDALDLGFQVFVIQDACKPVELNPGDEKAAYIEMAAKGIHIINSKIL